MGQLETVVDWNWSSVLVGRGLKGRQSVLQEVLNSASCRQEYREGQAALRH